MQRSIFEMASAILAGRVFRIAAVAIIALILSVAVFVVAEEQCEVNGGGALCARSPPTVPIIGASSAMPAATGDKGEALETGSPDRTTDNTSDNASAVDQEAVELPQDVGFGKLIFALLMVFSLLAWLLTMLKFAVDGSLPARLALWGLLPEAYAAISVNAVYHLLRLKTTSTPVVILQNCVTDAGAEHLAQAMKEFGVKADLEAVELPHNPLLTTRGLQAIVDAALLPTSKVVELDLSYNPQLGAPAVKVLKSALVGKTSRLQVLKLADIGLTQAGLKEFAQIASKSKLRVLDLGWNSMKGCGEVVADIMEAPVIEELILTCCDLDPDDVGVVAEQLKYTSIRALQLGGNRFGSDGVVRLCEHLPDCQVDELGLEAVGLEAGCAGLEALAAAWVRRPFSRLRIHSNRMTDEEVATFVKTLRSMQL